MRRRHLGADTRLAFWYHREEEPGDINPFFLQFTSKLLRHDRITQHHRDDGVIGTGQGETCGAHFFTEQTGVRPQAIAQPRAGLHHLQYLDGGGNNGRRQGVGEQIRAGALTQPFNHLFTRSGITTGRAAERFAQRTGDDIHAAQAYAVDDGGVVQGVGDNRIFCAKQGLKQTAVGVEAGGVENRVFHSKEARQLLLKLLVAVLGTANKAYGGHTETVSIHAVFRCGNQLRVIRKT